MIKYFLIPFCFLSLSFFAQKKCGSAEYMSLVKSANTSLITKQQEIEKQIRLYETQAARGVQGSVVTIPVVFHVVYSMQTQNISDAKLFEQLDVLNEDFRKMNSGAGSVPFVWQGLAADCEINFCLAKRDPNAMATTGITRTQSNISQFGFDDKVKSTALGGRDAWDTKKYINIWVCDLGSTLYGYTPFPGGDPLKDGIVLNYKVTGRPGLIVGADLGHTATHEIGHYFNLIHIWADDVGCNNSDNVSDTPDQGNSTSGCPSFPQTDACSPNAPGIMFMNFMDYTDDACMTMFTNGQKTRMLAMLDPVTGSRKDLRTSDGCNAPVGITEKEKAARSSIKYLEPSGQYLVSNAQDIDHLVCYNLYGQKVSAMYNSSTGLLDLSGLSKGLYIINLMDSENNIRFVGKVLR
jgi:hypothetical protein